MAGKYNISLIYGTGLGVLIVLILIVLGLAYGGIGSIVITPISVITGTSVFGVFYILAQFIERCIEPISNSTVLGGRDDPNDQDQKTARLISLWCIASGAGIFLCYITVGLFQTVGITFLAGFTLGGHLLDAIVSGVVVGSGTKPLHDLINLVDNKGN